MTVYFIECSTPQINYLRGEIINNKPLNLANCISLEKKKFSWYPDNVGLPSISFYFQNKEEIWVYKSIQQRDADYQRILTIRV